MDTMTLNVLICILGLLLHFAMKWADARAKAIAVVETAPTLWDYLANVPAQSAVSVIAAAAAFSVTASMGWLNPGMAFACGYMGNSITDNLSAKFSNQFKG